jgi:hypothetical protein
MVVVVVGVDTAAELEELVPDPTEEAALPDPEEAEPVPVPDELEPELDVPSELDVPLVLFDP